MNPEVKEDSIGQRDGDYRRDQGNDTPRQQAARGSSRYREVSLPAVASVAVGLFCWLTIFSWYLWLIPVLGTVLAVVALRRIRRSEEDLSGAGLALAGLGLSLGLGVVGGGILAFSQISEVPPGYQRISFKNLQPDREVKGQLIPPKAYDLQGDLVFIKGYMYPGRRTVGVKSFILVPTRGHCSFCSRRLKSTEMVQVTMAGDLTIDYRIAKAGLGGRFRIDPSQVARPFGGLPYQLEADYVK